MCVRMCACLHVICECACCITVKWVQLTKHCPAQSAKLVQTSFNYRGPPAILQNTLTAVFQSAYDLLKLTFKVVNTVVGVTILTLSVAP